MTTTSMEDSLPEDYLLSPKYFAKAGLNVFMEDRKVSSIELEFWGNYLANFPGESLLPLDISADGSDSVRDGDLCSEDFTDCYIEDWAKIFMSDEPFLEYLTLSEPWIDWGPVDLDAHVALSELPMDWLEWSELIDAQDQQPKIRPNVCKKGYSASIRPRLQSTRRGPTRGGVTKVLRHDETDCLP